MSGLESSTLMSQHARLSRIEKIDPDLLSNLFDPEILFRAIEIGLLFQTILPDIFFTTIELDPLTRVIELEPPLQTIEPERFLSLLQPEPPSRTIEPDSRSVGRYDPCPAAVTTLQNHNSGRDVPRQRVTISLRYAGSSAQSVPESWADGHTGRSR